MRRGEEGLGRSEGDPRGVVRLRRAGEAVPIRRRLRGDWERGRGRAAAAAVGRGEK
jgi:hypothetical protein